MGRCFIGPLAHCGRVVVEAMVAGMLREIEQLRNAPLLQKR